jgi:hypothetical protein
LRGKQRVTGFRAADLAFIGEILQWYRQDSLRCAIQIGFDEMNPEMFHRLSSSGLISRGSGTIGMHLDKSGAPEALAGSVIRESTALEKDLYLDIFQQCFSHRSEGLPEYRTIQWAEDSLPSCKRYLMEIEGKPVAFASMPVIGGVAFCGTSGTLPSFRGRRIQQHLIHQRIKDAANLKCSMLLGGASIDTTPHRNFERCGFRLVPLGMNWVDHLKKS